jgi:hypothetical protein
MHYPIPPGLHSIHTDLLDVRPDSEIDCDILHPKSISNEKNLWLFWHTGYTTMHPSSQRNIHVWHRRFSPQGRSIRVLDLLPFSPSPRSTSLTSSTPQTHSHSPVHSPMVPLAATTQPSTSQSSSTFRSSSSTAGVYADVELIQIGDLDRLWRETVDNPTSSRFQVLSYHLQFLPCVSQEQFALCEVSPAFAAVVGWEDKYEGDAW